MGFRGFVGCQVVGFVGTGVRPLGYCPNNGESNGSENGTCDGNWSLCNSRGLGILGFRIYGLRFRV